MTNTPMTFEEWLKTKECDANYGFHRLSEYRTNMCKEVWQASQAQQASVIAELVEALDKLEQWAHLWTDESNGMLVNTRALIAKVKGNNANT